MPTETSLFEEQIRLLARQRNYAKFSCMLEGVLHRDGEWKPAFAEVKMIIDDEGLDGVDILVRSQLLLLRRMRGKADERVRAYRESLDQVRITAWMNPGERMWFADELIRYQRHRDNMDAEIKRLRPDHPHLRRWKK